MAITERDRIRLLDGFRGTLDDEQLATMSELVHDMSPDLATRTDLQTAVTQLRAETAELGSQLRSEMAELRSDLHGEMAELRGELRGEMAELRSEMGELSGEVSLEMSRFMRLNMAAYITTVLIVVGLMFRIA